MSGTFWAAQPERAEETGARTPVWAWLVTALDLLILLAVIPVVILVVVPFFVVFYLYLASLLVWASPVLVAGNIALFAWSFRRKAAAKTALSILSVLFVVLSWVLLVLWNAPLVVLGISL